ncbi:MAG: phosphomethylpyrimidine synthase ThiC [Candidatus Aureabacteria bacterium]|nr:phosphomethylpyrimidine synthase ThiC [Candidatus Auribacterota bacterium]
MNTLEAVKKGILTQTIKRALSIEKIDKKRFFSELKAGKIVIPKNSKSKRKVKVCAVGQSLKVKVNANIGTSVESCSLDTEKKKAVASYKAGADFIMDLSTGGNLGKIRKAILKTVPLPLGTVPVYEAAVNSTVKKESFLKMTVDDFFDAIEKQAKDGVDFITVHCGLNMASLERLNRQGRLMDIVSRGGAITAKWMVHNGRENPYYEYYGRLLEIAKKYDLTLSLGDAMRPGCLKDATDRAQIQELIILGELASHALKNGVQAMIEGPGHIPLNQIEENMKLQQSLCKGAPFYVLGPLVTDIAPGYDHITSAIGGALAAWKGASLLCYVTPAEHLKLPDESDAKKGVIASRIAAHAADIAKGIPGAQEIDDKISKFRKKRYWKKQFQYAIDPEKAAKMRKKNLSLTRDICTMCGEYCSMKDSKKQ